MYVQRWQERAQQAGGVIVLNLGCGTEGERSWHPIEGAVNLDKSMGWRFEDGLRDYADGSVDGVSISHSIMYVALADWPAMFAEFARVLRDGGVVRITEDATDDTRSRTFGRGWHDAVTLTSAAMVKEHLRAAGLVAHDCGPTQTMFESPILLQKQHGDAPDVFWCEGVRMTRVLFAPHHDDETLFSAFTILKYRPHVVVCFSADSDYGSNKTREAETREAMTILGAESVAFWGIYTSLNAARQDVATLMRSFDLGTKPSLVFAPNRKASHPEHVATAEAAAEVFGSRLRTYHTYDENGKVREGTEAPFELIWAQHKLRALARYPSQIAHPRACTWFLNDLREYLGQP